MARILILEDNMLLRHHLSVQMREMGHQVDVAENTIEADFLLQEFSPDIAIVDLGLPGEDGISLIQRWRKRQVSLPILVLTARDNWQDKVSVLQAGADDYVTKPFHLEEVVARMQALMRRNCGFASQIMTIGPFAIDLSGREVTCGGSPIKLTGFEFTIMETLMRNAGQVVKKDNLILQLYPTVEPKENHTIDVLVGRLRKKLLAVYAHEVITTVRGQGYRFDVEPLP
ncbi:two-component system response regulator PhoP [Budvicia diplopodorum]|uniref:two-component system response regulator PhoP n=1 Tax=Budvicia diplopodorum TaxID=1119056 RepID=UPI00135B9BAA|nr:two-component system response regulator PhoP [Budvicia diplopodorum]